MIESLSKDSTDGIIFTDAEVKEIFGGNATKDFQAVKMPMNVDQPFAKLLEPGKIG